MTRHLLVAIAVASLIGCAATTATTPTPPVSAAHTIALGDNQKPIGLLAAGGWLYAACSGTNGVTLLDTATAHDLHPFPLATGAPGFERTFLDRREVLVSDPVGGAIYVIDANADAASPSPKLLQHLDTAPGEARVAIMEDNNTIAATAGSSDQVYVFKFAEDRAQAPTKVTFPAGGAASDGRARPVDLQDRTLLVPDLSTGEVNTFQLGSTTKTKIATLRDVGPLAIGTVNGKAVAAVLTDKGANTIQVVDLESHQATTLADVGTGPANIALAPDDHRAFVTMTGSNEVAVVDYVAKTLVNRVPVGQRPSAISAAPPIPGEMWVANDDGTVSVLDGKADKPMVRATLAVGAGEHHITFWGQNGYVSNGTDGTLSILDRSSFRSN